MKIICTFKVPEPGSVTYCDNMDIAVNMCSSPILFTKLLHSCSGRITIAKKQFIEKLSSLHRGTWFKSNLVQPELETTIACVNDDRELYCYSEISADHRFRSGSKSRRIRYVVPV